MTITHLSELELEFGGGNRHADIRFGLMEYGPLDQESQLAPKVIHTGIVGTNQTIAGVVAWLEHCRDEIAAKPSRQPNLFPRFPGFKQAFGATLVLDPLLHSVLAHDDLTALMKSTTGNRLVRGAVDMFVNAIQDLENKKVDLIICAPPFDLVDAMDQRIHLDEEREINPENVRYEDTEEHVANFHDLLKARTNLLKKPIQIVLPSTYDERQRRTQRRHTDRARKLQDEATRAWNFHTALYYKAGGAPWRIQRDSTELTTCYVGVSFYFDLKRDRLLTSTAQVFNERGDGIIVRGGVAKISKEDRQAHLSSDDSCRLLVSALLRYRQHHRTLPARVVVYKTSTFNEEEVDGFLGAAQEHRVDVTELLSVRDSTIKLFREGAYPPLRGTFLSVDPKVHVLYTRGSVPFYSTYPGMYVPRALEFSCHHTEQTPLFLAKEILALTKMNWNNTQFDGAHPICVRAARRVGSILRYIDEQKDIEARYSFYM